MTDFPSPAPTPPLPFGRQYLAGKAAMGTNDVAAALAAERSTGRADAFARIDHLTAQLADAAFAGAKPVVAVHRAKKGPSVTLPTLEADDQQLLAETYGLNAQQKRGAWYLPEQVKLTTGYGSIGSYRTAQPEFLMNAIRDDTVTVEATDTGTELYLWTVLLPFLTTLMSPLDLRAPTGKPQLAGSLVSQWTQLVADFRRLDLNVEPQLQALAPESSWMHLGFTAQVATRNALMTAIAGQITSTTVAAWRMHAISELSAAFYRKAKSGTPLSTAVLTKALQPTLSGVFAGSWARFLDYLGEDPNPAEQTQSTLPEPRLYTGATDRVTEVATTLNLPADDVAAMLAAYLGTHHDTQSPVGERTTVMTQWWQEFDRIHADQKPGDRPLWGLVDEPIYTVDNPRAPTPYGYQQLLSTRVVADVDRLWDGLTLDRWPERTVSEFQPHRLMAEAFGPALILWHEIGLTCWFVCEGPYARTQLPELRGRYSDQREALATMGFPVDDHLFTELTAAEHRLGPERPYRTQQKEVHVAAGITLTTTFDDGARRRDGFQILRDIVTHHRRTWADAYLQDYLRARWDSELRAVAREYSRRHAATGRTVTYKQFAKFASDAANHWFNGNLGAVYAAVGEVAPTTPRRHDLLEGHPAAFLAAMSTGLRRLDNSDTTSWERGKLAARALRYLQLQEALGRPPTEKEFGANQYRWDIFNKDADRLWEQYVQIIEQARTTPQTRRSGTSSQHEDTWLAPPHDQPVAHAPRQPGQPDASQRAPQTPTKPPPDAVPAQPPSQETRKSAVGRLIDRIRGRTG